MITTARQYQLSTFDSFGRARAYAVTAELKPGDVITEHSRLCNSEGRWRLQCSGPGIFGRGWVSLYASDGSRLLEVTDPTVAGASPAPNAAADSLDALFDGAPVATPTHWAPAGLSDLFGSAPAPNPTSPSFGSGGVGDTS